MRAVVLSRHGRGMLKQKLGVDHTQSSQWAINTG